MAKKGAGNFTKQLTKEQKEEYINNRYEEAKTLTNNIDIYINKLNNIINSNCREISIEEFIKRDLEELNLPKNLLVPYKKPDEINIRKANIIEKILKSPRQKYDLYVKETKDKYQKEYDLYEKNEAKRLNEIKSLTQSHQLKINEAINIKKELYKNRDATIISNYKEEILNQIDYPIEFRKCINIGYCKDSKKLVVDYLLPDIKIIPDIKRYEYKKTKDEIKSIPMNEKERNSIYNQVVLSIVLNSMDNLFKKDIDNNIDTIVFTGYIKDVDLATGQDISPYIVSAMVDKAVFNKIDMNRIDKLKCFKETMQGRIDINSNLRLKEIFPICKSDYLNKSVINNEGINLLEVDPFTLEDLVITLFSNMGYDVMGTNRTNDGGIDCILNNNDPIMGGKVIGQVKRYKNNIDIPKLREFESVLRNSDAMKGIFISTSNFSTQCEKFAADNNISLINGSLLVDYFNQYGINSYILNRR
ncbi:restriction endonuclease [Romboutsia ilealis]|uniref:Restriction endonuclease n=1 Tax=Romboutsia faecis TaxID=2764597 RepID=A0ABR7JNT1_9FIRM|nr:restriction endonuclease [Romboutsia faecis]MBC5996558.1 restriction endonuclease [Romboutsia faecis]MRN24084.1 restriction endonuclease [Romboutsia ilealis]